MNPLKLFAGASFGTMAYMRSKSQAYHAYKMELPLKFHLPKTIIWTGVGLIIPTLVSCPIIFIVCSMECLFSGKDLYKKWYSEELENEALKKIQPIGIKFENEK